MIITAKNLKKEFPKIKGKLPVTDRDSYNDIVEMLPLYDDDKEIKEVVDMYLVIVNNYVGSEKKNTSQEKAKKTTAGRKTAVSKKTPAKPKKVKQFEDKVKNRVVAVPMEISLLKRYANLNAKRVTLRQILLLHKAIEKAAISKAIRKTSKYSSLIETIDNDLVKTYNENRTEEHVSFSIPEDIKKRIDDIADNNKEMFSISYIKRFINLIGNNSVEKSKNLLNLIEKAKENSKIKGDDPYISHINSISRRLNDYLRTQNPINIKKAELNGLEGIAGVKVKERVIKDNEVMGFDEIGSLNFTGVGYTGRWKRLIGDPSEPIRIMVWGIGGSGKSSLVLKFLYFLASELDKKCLYIVGEESIEGTFREKVARLGVAHPNLHAVRSLSNVNLNNYDYLVHDSVTALDISPKDLEILYKKYPKHSVINIHHSLKSGEAFKGDSGYHHDIDTEIKVWFDPITGKHYAKAIKNRWGGAETICFLNK